MQQQHERDFAEFEVSFDHYGSTHSRENREFCEEFWQAIRQAGLVKQNDVEQLYDAQAGTFLADRFVRGTCPNPKCRARNQPGDNCSVCGSTYTPAELLDPVSTLTGTTPGGPHGTHLFIELEQLHDFLERWTQSDDHLQPETANYLKGHFLGDPVDPKDASCCETGISLAPLPTSASKSPTARATTGTCGSMHRSATSRRPANGADDTRKTSTHWWRSPQTRNPPLHRQRHHLLPHAVLARHAPDRRLQLADAKCTSMAS